MASKKRRFKAMNLLVGSAATLIILYGIKILKPILVPLSFALLFGVICSGLVRWFRSKGLSYVSSVISSVLLLASLVTSILVLLSISLQEMAQIVEASKGTLELTLNQGWAKIQAWLSEIAPSLAPKIQDRPENSATIVDLIIKIASNFLAMLFQSSKVLGLALVFSFFILLELPDFEYKMNTAFQDTLKTERLVSVVQDIQSYLQVKTFTSLITGLLITIGLSLIGVRLAILWGILAFALNYIPFVGSIVAAIPAVLFSLLNVPEHGISVTLMVISLYIFTNVLVSNFIEPTMMSSSLGLSPIVVFGSLVFWGFLWGPAGMLLSVPFTMVLKIIFENSEDLRWAAIMLSNKAGVRALVEQED